MGLGAWSPDCLQASSVGSIRLMGLRSGSRLRLFTSILPICRSRPFSSAGLMVIARSASKKLKFWMPRSSRTTSASNASAIDGTGHDAEHLGA